MSSHIIDLAPGRKVFVSYRRLDDEPPPESPTEAGFVKYLSKQIRYELSQLGVPDAILWRDRAQIAPGDDWTDVIQRELQCADLFLAVVSRNYVRSPWCRREILTMAERIGMLEASARERRIFRVDKHRVPDDDIPEPLRLVQSVRFYDEDEEANENVFFWRGKPVRKDEYLSCVRVLANAIYDRLTQLGIAMRPKEELAKPISAIEPNGRVVFVAKPASDLNAEYCSLVHELLERGYTVTPAFDQTIPPVGDRAIESIDVALSKAELSIHLLGKRRGFRPEGLQDGIVQLQLARAAIRAGRIHTFQRLIWAPTVFPTEEPHEALPLREPLEVLEEFHHRLPNDQIDGAAGIKFTEFVLQRLAGAAFGAPEGPSSVYLCSALNDRSFLIEVARELKKAGLTPLLRPFPTETTSEEFALAEETLLSRVRNVVMCWGSASNTAVISELANSTLRKWKAMLPTRRTVTLLMGPPCCSPKIEVAEFGIGENADLVVAGYSSRLSDALTTDLLPALNR